MKLLQMALKQLETLKQLELQLKAQIQEQQKNTSEKPLRLSKSNGIFQYYIEINNKRSYIKKKNIQLAKTLAQRDYNKKLIPCIAKNIDILENFTRSYSPQNCINCFSSLPTARKLLVTPMFMDDTTYARQWQAQKFEPKKDPPEVLLGTLRQNG